MKSQTRRFGGRVPIALIAVAVTAVLFALAGCGGGGDSTSATSGPSEAATITKAELISKGDAICRKTDRVQREALRRYEDKHGEVRLISKVEKMLVKVALPPIKTEISELSALGAPDGEEAEVAEILTSFTKGLKATEMNTYTLLNTGEGEFTKSDRLAKEYGFSDCAQIL